ncbi:hypothetical protein B0A50_02879 [Salinomyces thailandicus]|uniref:PH domain-containing protein n=1 Tax=Salinomyces thailandicus TaxID=706561 RepID=A0A4U0U4X1_9PEZI|nr:hypothetical protein B0A50_02879 [Salinomyces thailandica]
MRTRPSQILKDHHAEPLSPLKQADKNSKLQNRQSNMPLFNLFSKPKVEKSRGYAEQGLSPVASRRGLDGDRSNPDFSLSAGNGKGRDELPRAQSALSFRGKASRTTGSPKNGNPTSHGAQPRKNAAWEAPPLFQAYPQSIKHGMLGVSLMTAESVLQKSKSRMATGTHGSGGKSAPRGSLEDTGSTDTRRGAKTTMRHVANGAVGYVELPRKIFVLATSGYLLQYAESGPSNRLPERLLELGEESAAYACDLIPGKHHVLQVSQAVDSSGVMIANSGGIFAKLGMRSAAAKRITSHFLLVMPDAREMESWMAAIRLEIEGLSKNARPKTGVGPASKSAAASASGFDELKKMPSMSHRYQVKRDPTSPRLVEKPSADAFDTLLPPPRIMDDDENSAADTIEGIENDAERLAEEAKSQPRKKTRDHDTQSTTSSAAGGDHGHFEDELSNGLTTV